MTVKQYAIPLGPLFEKRGLFLYIIYMYKFPPRKGGEGATVNVAGACPKAGKSVKRGAHQTKRTGFRAFLFVGVKHFGYLGLQVPAKILYKGKAPSFEGAL